VLEPSKPKLNCQGRRWFSFFNFVPAYNNAMPFHFHTALIYEGLISGRDRDQTGAAFALGNYSYNKILADYSAGRTVHQTMRAFSNSTTESKSTAGLSLSRSFNI
jgi:hypothetical protein